MPTKKEVEMKMILVVLMVRVIVSMVEKNKNVTDSKNESRTRIIHPAEFEIR
jgi:energy-converting hydrogenase Eha subunit H